VLDYWEGSFVSIIDPRTGELIAEYERSSHGMICFIDAGSRFVDPAGGIFESISGQLLTTLKGEPKRNTKRKT
jgi:hypothetical protein